MLNTGGRVGLRKEEEIAKKQNEFGIKSVEVERCSG